jgi:hypothetical protein
MKVLNAVASSDGVGVSGRVSYGVLEYGFAVEMESVFCADHNWCCMILSSYVDLINRPGLERPWRKVRMT